MADQKISQLTDAGAPQNTDQLALARAGASLSVLWSSLKAAVYAPGGTDVAIVDGGTGASDAATARTNLGLGTAATHATGDFDTAGAATAAQAASQPLDSDLTAVAALDSSTAGAIASDGAGWIKKTYTQFKTALVLVASDVGLGNVTNDAQLKASDLDTDGTLAANSDTKIASQKATKTYVDANAATLGRTALVYRYTVTGSDKASIDTGVDTPDAGSNDWTNGDLLEILFYLRTDDAAATATVALVLNNNTGSIYDRVRVTDSNTTVTGANVLASAEYDFTTLGSTAAAGAFGASFLYIPNFAGTVGWKAGMFQDMLINTLAASTRTDANGFQFRDTTAISRLKIAAGAGQKLKVGSQLLIYKRLAS